MVTTNSGNEVAPATRSVPTKVCPPAHDLGEFDADERQPGARDNHDGGGGKIPDHRNPQGDFRVAVDHCQGYGPPALVNEGRAHRHEIENDAEV